MSTSRHLALAVAAALAMVPAAARADDRAAVPAKARALAERGKAFHEAGKYPQAIAAYTQAYVIAPSPALLFNLAQSYRLEGNCDDAVLMYQRYLATDPSPEGRELAESHLASMERCVHKIALHIPVDTVGAIPSGATAAPAPTTTATASLTADMPGTARKARLEKDVGIGLAAGGGLALIGAVYFAAQASSAASDVTTAETKGGPGKNVGALDDRGHGDESKARILAIGGGLGVIAGIVMYVVGRNDEPPPVAFAPVQHGRGAAVSMGWTF